MTEVVELYVVMHCEACAAAVRRAIRKTPGVESYKLDFYGQKVTVIGKVDREDVWRRIHKTGKRVTLIPKPAPPKQEKKEEKKETKKEEKKDEKEEKKEDKAEEKKEEKTEEKKETKVVDKEETILVRKKSVYWPAVRLWRFLIPREVKIHEKEEVAKLVETEEKKEDAKGEEKTEGKEEKKEKKKEKAKEPEWVPLLVTAPFYTLPTSVY
ncbi:hypothetical protein KC19_6G033300 [Ceratodon purpureus]|uniref:HMA domain-containing protein n=1 Tax=Ceratodon purpureus TaxID=3225 RepID=A0A8T0HB12_CERPU|nr:hypothetical protein KC19_6G033300 [Ceratodon purpureus]